MPKSELSQPETAVLLVLMAEAREIPNAELTARGLSLSAGSRRKLNDLKLLESRTEKNRYYHLLTDLGWAWCNDRLLAEPPGRPGSYGVALFAVLAGLGRHFARVDRRLGDVFLPPHHTDAGTVSPHAPVPRPRAAVEDRIRTAYAGLAPEPSAWVSLTRLRQALGDLPRAEVDDALTQMSLLPEIHIVPESNQKTLTDPDREAAVNIGDQDKHLLAIGAA